MAARLPTFFVIGASKAGTTSLHHYLGAHPQIEMTDPKEPHLLCGPSDYRDRLFVYDRLFAGATRIRGEASPGYAVYPHDAEVPDRIAEIAPDARLVYLVRDPVERAIAHYAEHVIQGAEARAAAVALDPGVLDAGGLESPYLAASRYATQAERYLRRFAPEQLLIVDSAELRRRRREALGKIFAHVGAEPEFWDPSFSVEHYSRTTDNTRRTAAERAVGASGIYRRVLRPLVPATTRRRVARSVRRRFGSAVEPELDQPQRERLAQALGPEAQRLRALTGQRFAGWSV
jgi:hypothetical protein